MQADLTENFRHYPKMDRMNLSLGFAEICLKHPFKMLLPMFQLIYINKARVRRQ